MTDKTRIKIAAGITALFLAAISAAGLAARTDEPEAAAAAEIPAAVQTPTAAQAAGPAPSAQSSTYEDEGYGSEEGEDDD